MDFRFDISPLKENTSPMRKSIGSLGSGISPYKEVSLSSLSTSGISKSPLKNSNISLQLTSEINGSANASLYGSKTDGAHKSSYASLELLQKRIEHLERERVDLSLQLHSRDEKERSKLKLLEQAKEDLTASVLASRKEIDTLRTQREILETEVKGLKALSSTSNTAQAEGWWNKMTAAARELRRVEEEAHALRSQAEVAAKEKDNAVGRIETLESKVQCLECELTSANETIENLNDVTHMLKQKSAAADSLADNVEILKASIVEKEEEMRVQKEAFLSEETKMLNDNTVMRLKTKELALDLEKERQLRLEMIAQSADGVQGELAVLNSETVLELKEQLHESERKRRKLHNALQELKGNIRVYVRCRPFLRVDGSDAGSEVASSCVQCGKDSMSVSLVGTSARGSSQVFAYDHVFQPDVTQNKVYNEVSDFIQSSLDGYRVCIFSYGQTGSGKTHTMSGSRSGDERGIIPRAVEHIVREASEMRAKGWEITLKASMVELYNEELRDLLISTGTDSGKDAENVHRKLKILYQNGCVQVPGIVSIPLASTDVGEASQQLHQLLEQATRNRSTACTAMNETSSRSHALFMLDIFGKHSDGLSVMRGGLRLCDLAGSERLDRTGTLNDAARLKETVNINKSLSCLADVFTALSAKQAHIPYRNSKLTMLLQDCLSGDGKSLMIVNLSPTLASLQETLCSLRFASQVSKVELGKAQKTIMTLMPAQNSASSSIESSSSYTSRSQSSKLAQPSLAEDAENMSMRHNGANASQIGSASSRLTSVMATHQRMNVKTRENTRQSVSKRTSTMPSFHANVRESAMDLTMQQAAKKQRAPNTWR